MNNNPKQMSRLSVVCLLIELMMYLVREPKQIIVPVKREDVERAIRLWFYYNTGLLFAVWSNFNIPSYGMEIL